MQGKEDRNCGAGLSEDLGIDNMQWCGIAIIPEPDGLALLRVHENKRYC